MPRRPGSCLLHIHVGNQRANAPSRFDALTALLERLSGLKVVTIEVDRLVLRVTLPDEREEMVTLLLDPLTSNVVDVQVYLFNGKQMLNTHRCGDTIDTGPYTSNGPPL